MNPLQKTYEPKIIDPPTKEEKQEAHDTHQKIMALITTVKATESELEHSYVTLGKHIYHMQAKTLWIPLGYNNWREYFDFLQDKFGKGRTQLYGYVGSYKTLSPHMDDETMEEMGISKAKDLKRAIDQTGKAPSDELLVKAKDKNVLVPEFREAVHKEFHIIDSSDKGIWMDLHGIYLLPDEKEELLKCFDIAKKIDPVIDHTLPAHAQMKEVLFRLVAEFMNQYGAYGGDVDGFNQVYKEANSKQEDIFG